MDCCTLLLSTFFFFIWLTFLLWKWAKIRPRCLIHTTNDSIYCDTDDEKNDTARRQICCPLAFPIKFFFLKNYCFIFLFVISYYILLTTYVSLRVSLWYNTGEPYYWLHRTCAAIVRPLVPTCSSQIETQSLFLIYIYLDTYILISTCSVSVHTRLFGGGWKPTQST